MILHKNTNRQDVIRYYSKTESIWGYNHILKGTKHFGYYNLGDSKWMFSKSLRQMETFLVEKLSPLPKRAKVLDAGCGVGDVSRHVALHTDYRVTGIDILPPNLDEAARRAAKTDVNDRVTYSNMDYGNMQFTDETFDGIYTVETLVHAADSRLVLSEFFRVLKPGGKIVLFEYERDEDAVVGKEGASAFRYINKIAAMPSFQKFLPGVLEGEICAAGLKIKNITDITSNMLPMLRAFSLIAKYPYKLFSLLGKKDKVINAMSAVELWKHRDHFRYKVFVAEKPKVK
jgi:2-polyprenyl-3-methyl-5-hydroxy-6-metoxy-1,4-benzoquinol methylase